MKDVARLGGYQLAFEFLAVLFPRPLFGGSRVQQDCRRNRPRRMYEGRRAWISGNEQ